MFNIFGKKSAMVAGILLSIGLLASQSYATMLTLVPEVSTIHSGEFVKVAVILDGLDDGVDVSFFNFDVNFDADVLVFDSYSLTDQLGIVGSDPLDPDLEAVDLSLVKSDGCLNLSVLSYLSFLPDQDEPLTLATITFKGKNKGISELSFTLNDASIGDFWGSSITVTPSTASITNVAEPSSFILSLFGIFGLVSLVIRRKTN